MMKDIMSSSRPITAFRLLSVIEKKIFSSLSQSISCLPVSRQTVGTLKTSFLYWLLPFLQSPDWCCLRRTLTMPFCLVIFKVENMLKLTFVCWHCLASIPTQMFDHFLLLLSVSCVPKSMKWGTPMPPNPFPILLSYSLTQGQDKRRTGRTLTYTFYFDCSVLFSFLASWGQAWLFIMQAAPWALTVPPSLEEKEKEQKQQNVQMFKIKFRLVRIRKDCFCYKYHEYM